MQITSAINSESRLNYMKSLEKFLFFMFPSWMILSPSRLKKFNDQEIQIFKTTMSFALPMSILVYIGHYYFFDLPMELKPKKLWFNYRFGISTLCFVTFLFYRFINNMHFAAYKVPALLTSFTICYFQTRTMLWYDQVPYLYSFLFMVITSFCLRLSPFYCILYICSIFYLTVAMFWQAGVNSTLIYSAFIVSLLFSIILSSMKYFQTQVFLANETLIDQQRANIEQTMEFTETLKSFLPKKISKRLDSKIANEKLSIHQAVDEVLRPHSMKIACLTCDIRGYTQAVKNNQTYIAESVIPLTRNESVIVEDHDGIPRKIGDQLFCYFDSHNLIENILNATMAAVTIALHEEESNKGKNMDTKIRKQILLSTGEAYVGNIGGHNSAIEITAMGTPVNFLSRLENVVKSKPYINEIPRNHVILSNEVKFILETLTTSLKFYRYQLEGTGYMIKDFPEVESFYSMEATLANYNRLKEVIEKQTSCPTRIAS